ncbi:hypothetical protein [uncultured Roseobacter sp.]|uniref:hypothetical protein n=1 Tax=uncultured Roseobacter sp. TaxID=114847 RepID=UPI0026208049|nr:hypothetical protein [uncultured Roseobacter sp.]
MTIPGAHENPAAFWEGHYARMTNPSGGRPSAILVRFTEGRTPGRALDLGCARGDDASGLRNRVGPAQVLMSRGRRWTQRGARQKTPASRVKPDLSSTILAYQSRTVNSIS